MNFLQYIEEFKQELSLIRKRHGHISRFLFAFFTAGIMLIFLIQNIIFLLIILLVFPISFYILFSHKKGKIEKIEDKIIKFVVESFKLRSSISFRDFDILQYLLFPEMQKRVKVIYKRIKKLSLKGRPHLEDNESPIFFEKIIDINSDVQDVKKESINAKRDSIITYFGFIVIIVLMVLTTIFLIIR